MLDPDKIKANLKTKRVGGKILVYDSTSSTNDIAAEYARNKKNDGMVIFTEQQAAGRGRAGNKWLSGRAQSILCSIILQQEFRGPAENKLNAELLSLTFAVAVAEAIGTTGGSMAKIKWPNDIMLNGKKVAGILLESKMDKGCTTFIVGIGINCHQKKESFPDELQQLATSIDAESNSISDRVVLAKRLLSSVDHWLKVAENNGEKVIDRWRRLSIQLSQRVTLLYNGSKFSGNCIGVDPEKGLILQLDTGGIRMFDAVHTSIAKSSA